uniref:Uncharacterized protein n=1 Tax=Anguilla anguilla TaxID=7936 RepID=A0A0E9VUR9_ANGAN
MMSWWHMILWLLITDRLSCGTVAMR